MTNRTIYGFGAAATVALVMAFVSPAAAQKYPDRPVKIVLPFGPGGVADVTARLVAEKLGEKLGQRFVIENMPGAGGISAANAVINAPPDGHTIGPGHQRHRDQRRAVQEPAVRSGARLRDGVHHRHLRSGVRRQCRVRRSRRSRDFIAATKRDPGKLNIGTINVGGTQNLGAELLRLTAKLDVQIVPYRNSPDIVVALLRNDMQMLVEFPPAVKGQVADGKLRLLATSAPKRFPLDAGRADRQ